MKNQAGLLIAIVVLLASCVGGSGKRERKSDFLPPIKIEIPASIQGDEGLTSLVKKSETAINEFSDNMEFLIEDIKPFQNKKEEDIGTFDQIKVTKIMAEFMMNSTKGMSVLEELSSYAEKRSEQKEPLTDQQIKAISVIYDTFEARMQQLNKKYEDFGGKKE